MEGERWKFVGGKVGNVVWLPHGRHFVTAAWDSRPNMVSLWCDEPEAVDPVAVASVAAGSTADMVVVDDGHVAVLSEAGTLSLLELEAGYADLVPVMVIDDVHSGGAGAALAAAPSAPLAATSPEEGGVLVVDWAAGGQVVAAMGGGPLASPVSDLAWVGASQIVAVGMHLEVWDTRSASAAMVLKDAGPGTVVHTVAVHPNQPDFLATGGSDGMLSVWDLRSAGSAVTKIHAHSSDVWDIEFSPHAPDTVFSCADDGTVLRWNFNANKDRNRSTFAFRDDSNIAIDQILDSMLPVNSLALSASDTLLCGADNGFVLLPGLPAADE
ncbi:uncharacterized protein AMSG_01342 [Thecamonas trahens ATCC 50062]|uniref:Uncharacterized protein n=1 Tax=Thecamonas trahens ATCC 50062 TaxID=461836 RepID=A0A0L0DQF1_THETB|nr:hypothetical protein AMSG_01342 [Thecamonas trahens ATCC 50062]KNC53633.1 hypothetical protein AMSG_01342 [Thecamonas trahens ATCC 50062]|eukprot:XP_013761950.1 hypothetical protein AMSG_01342 [Thecamonas trahens ATCC 50062]